MQWQETNSSGYSLLGTTSAGSISVSSISLLDYINAHLLLTVCVDVSCSQGKDSTAVTIAASDLPPAIGYIKAAMPQANESFGMRVAFSNDGNLMAIGATGGFGTGNITGYVDVFERNNGVWSHTTRLGASNPDAGDAFGNEVVVNHDGSIIAVSATKEIAQA